MNRFPPPSFYKSTLVFFCCVLSWLISSCGVKHNRPIDRTPEDTPILSCNQDLSAWQSEMCSFDTALHINGSASLLSKERSGISLSCSIDLVRNKGIRISVRPVIFIEAIRAYITPQSIEVYDLIHDNKAILEYSNLSRLLGCTISYNDLQDLLTGEVCSDAETSLSINRDQSGTTKVLVSSPNGKNLHYGLDNLCRPIWVRLSSPNYPEGAVVNYRREDQRLFPIELHLSLSETKHSHSIEAELQINSVEESSPSTILPMIERKPKGNFTEMSPQQLIGAFL